MRISDWSSDVCSSDLPGVAICPIRQGRAGKASASLPEPFQASRQIGDGVGGVFYADVQTDEWPLGYPGLCGTVRSEEHTSELVTNAHLVCRLLLEINKQQPERSQGITPTREELR